MKTAKVTIGNVFTQQLVKALNLKHKHKPYIVEVIPPAKWDGQEKFTIKHTTSTVIIDRDVITDRFLKLWGKDQRHKLVIK